MKKIFVQFRFPNVSAKQYDQAWEDMRAAGHEHPKGLLYHVSGQNGEDFVAVTVWESMEAFTSFGETLRPLLAKNGFPQVPPTVTPVHFEMSGVETSTAN
jgi:heme-degrading monooxygenase HmoA